MSEPLSMQIQLNGDGVVAPAQRAITICAQLVPILLAAINAADPDNPPPIEGAFWNISHPPHEDPGAVRAHFRQWVLAKALQELARGVRGALEEAALYLYAFGLDGANLNWGEFQARLAAEQARVNGRNFPQLLEEVSGKLVQPLEFAEEYLSLQRARSCLEHQDGVVLSRHLDPGSDRMTLVMPRYEGWAVDLDPPREIHAGMQFEKESRVEIRRGKFRLSFAEGARIVIDPADLLLMAQGCLLFVQDLAGKLPTKASG